MATQFIVDTYIVRLDNPTALLPPDDGAASEYRLEIFLRRLNKDDQHTRVKHSGNTFMRLKASTWDHEFLKSPQATRSVERIEINVRQQYTDINTDDYKDRVHGFRIATPELLEQSSSGKDRFKYSAAG